MTILVTGAFGCIGAWVVRRLLADGERPVLFDLADDPWRLRMIAGDDVPSRVTIVRGDITDRDQVTRFLLNRQRNDALRPELDPLSDRDNGFGVFDRCVVVAPERFGRLLLPFRRQLFPELRRTLDVWVLVVVVCHRQVR